MRQLGRELDEASIQELQATMAGRDTADSTRSVAPLAVAEDAVVIDTTDLTFEDQVARVLELAGNVFD